MKEGKRMFILLNWFILQIISFLGNVWVHARWPSITKGLPSSWSQNWQGFMDFVEKHWRGCLSRLFTSAIGLATDFSSLCHSLSNWNHSHILAENRLCHYNHMICSDFRWVKRRRISQYRTICFVFNVCVLYALQENILSSTAPAKHNSKKVGFRFNARSWQEHYPHLSTYNKSQWWPEAFKLQKYHNAIHLSYQNS